MGKKQRLISGFDQVIGKAAHEQVLEEAAGMNAGHDDVGVLQVVIVDVLHRGGVGVNGFESLDPVGLQVARRLAEKVLALLPVLTGGEDGDLEIIGLGESKEIPQRSPRAEAAVPGDDRFSQRPSDVGLRNRQDGRHRSSQHLGQGIARRLLGFEMKVGAQAHDDQIVEHGGLEDLVSGDPFQFALAVGDAIFLTATNEPLPSLGDALPGVVGGAQHGLLNERPVADIRGCDAGPNAGGIENRQTRDFRLVTGGDFTTAARGGFRERRDVERREDAFDGLAHEMMGLGREKERKNETAGASAFHIRLEHQPFRPRSAGLDPVEKLVGSRLVELVASGGHGFDEIVRHHRDEKQGAVAGIPGHQHGPSAGFRLEQVLPTLETEVGEGAVVVMAGDAASLQHRNNVAAKIDRSRFAPRRDHDDFGNRLWTIGAGGEGRQRDEQSHEDNGFRFHGSLLHHKKEMAAPPILTFPRRGLPPCTQGRNAEKCESEIERLRQFRLVSLPTRMPSAESTSTEDERDQLLRRIEELEARLAAEQTSGARRLQFAIEAAPNGILMTDARGRIVFANQRATEYFGYSREEMEGLPVEKLMPQRFRRAHVGLREHYHETPEQRPMGTGRDLYAQRKDGSEFPVEIGLTPVEIDGDKLALAMVTDITARRRGEEAMRSQARILESLHEAVFTVDAEERVETWNRGAELIFGWKEDEIVGQPVRKICPADDMRRFSDRIVPAVLDHGHFDSVLHCRRSDGGEVAVAIRASLASDSGRQRSDKDPRIILCANDISRQKELEDEIVQISEKEQRRIGQDIHDDLCQQLASIGCLTKVLRGQVTAEGKSATAEALEQIGEMISSANVRAREISRGLAPAVIQREGLTSALEELASRTRKVFGVPCVFHCPDPIFIDDEKSAVQLYRIAQEATANAVKHSDASQITIELTVTEDRLRLRISDDGRGLPPEAASRSSGLGLLTMNYRAGILDGELDIHSPPGQGTRITCTAPHRNE